MGGLNANAFLHRNFLIFTFYTYLYIADVTRALGAGIFRKIAILLDLGIEITSANSAKI